MPAFSPAILKNTPYTPETLDWSRLACQSVNVVLRGLDELNREGARLTFHLHRLKEDGFIFRITGDTADSNRIFLLTLEDQSNNLKVTLVELGRDGAFLPKTPLLQQLAEKVSTLMRQILHPEYVTWKTAFSSAAVMPYTSSTVH